MGKKRKHRDRSGERLLRRIEKLEDKLRKRRRRSPSYASSDRSYSRSRSESSDRYYSNKEDRNYRHNDDANQPPIDIESPQSIQTCHANRTTNTSSVASNEVNNLPSTSADSQPITSDDSQQAPAVNPEQPIISNAVDVGDTENIEINQLDEEILTLLGDAPKDQSPVGKDIHTDIATRLRDVLENGLKKELKEKITEEYPIPGNCQIFKAPLLNAEIKAAVSDLLQKKDASLAARQGQIGLALTALTSAMDILVTEKSETSQAILRHISNAARLLCDSHYIDTRMRRNFLISSLNNKLKDTLKESKRDTYLFGEVLPEKLKATKAITKTSQDLRSFKPKSVVTKAPVPSSSVNNLNWKHPQSNNQNAPKKPAAIQHHRSAGPTTTTSRRGEPSRKPTSSRANRTHVHYSYRQHKRS
ncbi:hypothetical protein NE865_10571 [Phthorimaea operculella]|nr:hypothetical protein NE865_10571 [Phthorimaea operculella]